jgi:hypothetical protein
MVKMTLGEGILFSSLLFSLVILFVVTINRWNWKKIILWSIAVLFFLAVLSSAGIIFYKYFHSKSSKNIHDPYTEKPYVQDSFAGISIDMNKRDVKFLKGAPDKIEGQTWIYKIQDVSYVDSYRITFHGDKIRSILYFGHDSLLPKGGTAKGWTLRDVFEEMEEEKIRSFEGTPILQGIEHYSSLEAVQSKFGKPSHISESDDQLMRLHNYVDYHVCFLLEKSRVCAYGIYNPIFSPLEIRHISVSKK